jgi:hypothetical protein
MAIQTVCGGCGKTLSVADEHAGKRARCPACGHIYTVAATFAQPSKEATMPTGYGMEERVSPESVEAGSMPPDASDQYWMRTADGAVYGPTDRNNLSRWFREGRVGAGYQIRRGSSGLWQDAAFFAHEIPTESPRQPAPTVSPSGNPYAVQPAASAMGSPGAALHPYPKPDRGVIVLVMGILSFVICGVFAIVAVIMGRSALNDINAGLANPNDKPLVQIGFWMGVVNLILHFLGIAFFVVFLAIAAISS